MLEKELYPILKSFKDSYVKDYEPKDTELMGLMISNYFKWDSRIIDAFQVALEDANFHTLNAKIDEERKIETI